MIVEDSKPKLERCIVCDVETDIPVTQHVDYRQFYVEGAGQLCQYCYYEAYDMD